MCCFCWDVVEIHISKVPRRLPEIMPDQSRSLVCEFGVQVYLLFIGEWVYWAAFGFRRKRSVTIVFGIRYHSLWSTELFLFFTEETDQDEDHIIRVRISEAIYSKYRFSWEAILGIVSHGRQCPRHIQRLNSSFVPCFASVSIWYVLVANAIMMAISSTWAPAEATNSPSSYFACWLMFSQIWRWNGFIVSLQYRYNSSVG